MKKIILSLAALCLCFPALLFSQGKCPVKKVFAYKQASLPGVQPKKTEEGGRERKDNFNYWIYITVPPSKKIEITGTWISGKKFNVKVEPIGITPVIKQNNDQVEVNKSITLVPETKNQVFLVYPSGENNDANEISKRVRKKLENNELVIGFTWKGKKRFAKKKIIKVLEPEVLQ